MTPAASTEVIVIDDDLRLAELTARQLRRLGLICKALPSLAALPDIRSNRAILVVDLSVLRLASPADLARFRSFRAVVMSGAGDSLARREAYGYGAEDYYVKPIEPVALRLALDRLD